MSTVAYKCPCCSSPLTYDGDSGKMLCQACGSQFDLEAVESMYNEQADEDSEGFAAPQETYQADDVAQMKAFHCKSCGAELITESTTTATECPYCGHPTIIPENINGGIRPERVVPFLIGKEQAQQKFEGYFKGKRLLPNIFLKSDNSIAEIRKLYVPYWLFDCEADATMDFDAEKRSTRREGEWEIEEIEHYRVHRGCRMGFEEIPVQGSHKLRSDITESLEPFDMTQAVPFQPAVLSGSLADHADVDAEDCEGRAIERVETSITQAIRDSVTGYTSVTERSRDVHAYNGSVTPVLMPIWLITTVKEGKTYTFAINGQTGRLTCDVPTDKGKAFLWGAGVFGGVFGLGALLLWLMKALGSGTLFMAGMAAMIAAMIVVMVLIGQLQQAVLQTEASDYVRSRDIYSHHDQYLRTTTNRRKVASQQTKK